MSEELVDRVLAEWLEEQMLKIEKEGEWWYQRLNDWCDLEKRECGKAIAIKVKTGEYLFAKTPQAAIELAKEKFGSVPIFAAYIHPYVAEAIVQVVGERGISSICEGFCRSRFGAFHRQCGVLFERLVDEIEDKLKSLPRHAHAVISVARGTYVIGIDPWEAQEKARVAFPVIGKEILGPSTLNGRVDYVPW